MAWLVVGVVGGGAASAASQPARGGRSTRHDRRLFGRLEQEDQRLKKHYSLSMDIVQSLELESFILTKLTKPFIHVKLVVPQVSLLPWWVPASSGSIHFLCVIRRHFLVCEDIAGGSELSAGVLILFGIIRRYLLPCGNGPCGSQVSASPCTSLFRCYRLLTMLTTPCREHQSDG